MSLTVVTDKSTFDDTMTKATIVIETDKQGAAAITELQDQVTKREAIKYAAQEGLPDPRINGSVEVFAVDGQGKEIVDQKPGETPHAFRAAVPLTRKLV
jgi:hypothetical protein